MDDLETNKVDKDKLFSQEEMSEYLDKPIPQDEAFRLNLMYSALYTILSLSSMPFVGMTDKYINLLEKLGQAGFTRAYYELGLLFYRGHYADKDHQRSYKYHELAAKAGYPDAQFELYTYLSQGIGCNQNEKSAVVWNQKAAENGSNRAMYNMGSFYATGNDLFKKDITKAVEWYQKASDAGNGKASATLGIMYYKGEEIAENKKLASDYFDKSAEQGFDVDTFARNFGINVVNFKEV